MHLTKNNQIIWRRIYESIAPASPLLWPVVFLALSLFFLPNVPIHWQWDNFSYLDAAVTETYYVPMGFGRTWFIGAGVLIKNLFVGENAPPYLLFRSWALTTIILQFLSLSFLALVLRVRLGLLFSHVTMAVFVSNLDMGMLYFGIWPETWSAIFLTLAIAILLLPNRLTIFWAAVSLGPAILMTMMKEISVIATPLLAAIVILRLSGELLWRRVLFAAVYGTVAGGVPLALIYLMPRFVSGLAEARSEWIENHFGQSNTGIEFFVPNIQALLGLILENRAIAVLIVLSVVGSVWRLSRRSWRLALLFLLAPAAGLLAPMVIVAATGRTEILERYVSNLVPGIALVAAMGFRRPLPKWMRPWELSLGVLTGVLLMVTNSWQDYLYHSRSGMEDFARYQSMDSLRWQRMGLAVGSDSWAAHYLQKHGRPDHQADWVIAWPNYDYTTAWRPDDSWIDQLRRENRIMALHHSIESNMEMTIPEYTENELPGWKFELHHSGWWLGSYQGGGQ